MSKSTQSEILGVLYFIASMIALDGGRDIIGWLFVLCGVICIVLSFVAAIIGDKK